VINCHPRPWGRREGGGWSKAVGEGGGREGEME